MTEMIVPSAAQLAAYAELIVRVGLNVQPGQRLMIANSVLRGGGVPLHTAPLVRQVVEAAYRAEARYVDVMWSDPLVRLARFRGAPDDSFNELPAWPLNAMMEYADRGDAFLSISADDPDLLAGQDQTRVATARQAALIQAHPFSKLVSNDALNWCVVAAPEPAWAVKVFPGLSAPEAEQQLWKAILTMCRVDKSDPIAAWHAHKANLDARRVTLNTRRYEALHLQGPGTDLTIGLVAGHIWGGGGAQTQAGRPFTPNLPTEEVYTLPHRLHADGVVTSTKPLSYGGTLIEGFSITFTEGHAVAWQAKYGEDTLERILTADEGSGRLGEIALVPHSSPISQTGVLFYNTLIDENAACHLAVGRGYRSNIEGGADMSDEEFAAAGGNNSLNHVDFMIGGPELRIDGVRADGTREPIMVAGEWVD